MTTYSAMIPQLGIVSDVQFRAACQQFHDALTHVGLIWLQDFPGQADLSTVSKPSSAYQSAGFRIYAFTDDLQPVAPAFLLANFGAGYDATCPGFTLSPVAVSPVGGGFAIVQSSGVNVLNAPGYPCGTALPSLFSGDGSRLQIALWRTAGSAVSVCSIERTKDIHGHDTAVGLIGHGAQTNVKRSMFWKFEEAPVVTALSGCLIPQQLSTGVTGSDTLVFPLRPSSPAQEPPGLGIMAYFDADFAKMVPVKIRCQDGLDHWFLPLGNEDAQGGGRAGAEVYDNYSVSATMHRMMRWE